MEGLKHRERTLLGVYHTGGKFLQPLKLSMEKLARKLCCFWGLLQFSVEQPATCIYMPPKYTVLKVVPNRQIANEKPRQNFAVIGYMLLYTQSYYKPAMRCLMESK